MHWSERDFGPHRNQIIRFAILSKIVFSILTKDKRADEFLEVPVPVVVIVSKLALKGLFDF